MDLVPCSSCGVLATKFSDVLCGACCPECKRWDKQMCTVANQPPKFEQYLREWKLHVKQHHDKITKSHIGNGVYQGRFAFSITASPSDNLSATDMIQAVKKLMAQKSAPVKYYAWYLEYGDMEQQTHPHIHGMYETESLGRIPVRQFKRVWSIWDEKIRLGAGHRGGYHRPVRDNEGYMDYIKKYNLENDSCLPSA